AYTVARPARQRIFRTTEPLPLSQLPPPAYHLLRPGEYLMGCLQFSSGCPFVCEFCDIPALYGRRPRFKTPAQVLADLEQLRRLGLNSVYFVDDNFIAQPKATLELLPHLVAWQQQHAYPLRLACEATLNLSAYPQVLELMRQAGFVTVFCGIETPELTALRALKKTQNLRRPILESIQTLNRYGLEVAAGIILGLDTDTPDTPQAILNFARESQIPLLAVNLLYALPHTPLYERLQREGRLLNDPHGPTNIRFRDPQETVLARWRQVIGHLYDPAHLYERLRAQFRGTYPNRLVPEQRWRQLTWRNLRRALLILSRIFWQVGWRSHYRRQFWPLCWTLLRRGDLEGLFQANIVAHHLISYTREALQGKGQASNYSLQQVAAIEQHSPAH
ncbi:MAG TPA: DUF4070 domain-containing protein, partial [Candidatus Sulfotelmatobacter sp.]|nr:DUF4070 domain-containing protein [Candidatus Sulfotelmatobacter sp.]